MRITDKLDVKCYTYDIETFLRCGFFLFYNTDTKKYIGFEISRRKSELFKFIEFLNKNEKTYFVGYNNLNFDGQVVTGILHKHKFWSDLSIEEIIEEIYKLAQRSIYLSNNESFQDYREDQLFGIQVDLMKINHYDNKNRRVSLKRLEFEIDFYNVQENPVDFRKPDLTSDEIDEMILYCKNDVEATDMFFNITLGNTDHPLYKENNQIELRMDIKEEFNIECLNWSDAKIGDEVIKKYYCEETGLKYNELPKKGTFRKEIKLKHCIPDYIEFQTEQLNKFLDSIRKKVLRKKDILDEEINFRGVKYSFKSGGLHSDNKNQKFVASEDMLISDFDGASFYPRLAIINGYYPYHLGKPFLKGYERLYDKRVDLKPLAKKDKRIKGIVGALKLALNGVYGKSGDVQSWLYDKQMTVSICIAGELTLMMLNEMYELNGIKVISSNTDGTTVMYPPSKREKVLEINKWFEEKTKIQLDETKYKWIFFSTVNDYIAEKIDPENEEDRIKQKGDIVTDFYLHMNKSKRVVNLALYDYFVNGTKPEDFIPKHQNIFDFCARQKASKDFHYEGISYIIENQIEVQKKNTYHQLVRYFIAKKGEILLKIKNPECTTNAAPVSNCEAPDINNYQPLVVECNKILPGTEKDLLENVDHWYYIDKAYSLIDSMEGRKFRSRRPSLTPQISMF